MGPLKLSPPHTGPHLSERIALCERCQLEIAGGSTPREGVAWNLSVVGMYLVLQADIPTVGTAINVTLWLPGDQNPVRAEAQVVWCNPPSSVKGCGANALRFPPGCGLRFVDISVADLGRIQARVETAFPHRARR